MPNFFKHLLDLLRGDDRFFADDGTFLRNAAVEAAMHLDAKLLRLLLNDGRTRENFFVDVDGVTVFDKIKFAWTVNNREFLPDSYTRFANRIGLVDAHENFIADTNATALVFPYKDCVLEGGQTADDQKRTEIFYNTTLAPDDVDRLLEPKVLTNATRYTAAGAAPAENFSDADNLIVKGNNLLALKCLEKIFAGKVKCIYIDPPYNTGNDSFGYNDRFNHSTWLTFMTNRLAVAKKLLRDDGSIWISIDDDEGHYLKVLADEIFDRDNFVATVIWEKKYTMSNDVKWLSDNHDFILIYAKDKKIWRPNLLPRTAEMDKAYKNPDNDPRGVWKPTPLHARSGSAASANFTYTFKNGVTFTPPPGRYARYSAETLRQLDESNEIWFGKDGKSAPQKKTFLSELRKDGVPSKTFWRFDEVGHTHEAREEIKALNPDNVFGTPKPERLLERILTLATSAGDLVLDYHLGSGTTAAVAHKMNRRYIGVEQLDYIKTLTVERLKKVIGGEQGGISSKIGWTGGGSFVYCELAELNQKFVNAAEHATDSATLAKILKELLKTGFISHKVDPAQIESSAAEFAALTLDGQKRFIMELLDKNLLYVNLCDIDDEEFDISDADKNFTRSFYFKSETTSPPTASAIAPKPTTAAIVRL